MIVAKASEKAVMAVGDAAARRRRRRPAAPPTWPSAPPPAALRRQPAGPRRPVPAGAYEDVALRSFSERADRVVARLRAV